MRRGVENEYVPKVKRKRMRYINRWTVKSQKMEGSVLNNKLLLINKKNKIQYNNYFYIPSTRLR